MIYNICLSLSDLIHSVWQSLGPSMSGEDKWQYFILFDGLSSIPLYIIPYFLYSFICWWTLRLLPHLAIVNKLLWRLGCMYLFKLMFSFSSDIYTGVEFLDHMVVLFLSFWGTFILISMVAVPTHIPTNSVLGFLFLHILANIFICCFLMIAILAAVRW